MIDITKSYTLDEIEHMSTDDRSKLFVHLEDERERLKVNPFLGGLMDLQQAVRSAQAKEAVAVATNRFIDENA